MGAAHPQPYIGDDETLPSVSNYLDGVWSCYSARESLIRYYRYGDISYECKYNVAELWEIMKLRLDKDPQRAREMATEFRRRREPECYWELRDEPPTYPVVLPVPEDEKRKFVRQRVSLFQKAKRAVMGGGEDTSIDTTDGAAAETVVADAHGEDK